MYIHTHIQIYIQRGLLCTTRQVILPGNLFIHRLSLSYCLLASPAAPPFPSLPFPFPFTTPSLKQTPHHLPPDAQNTQPASHTNLPGQTGHTSQVPDTAVQSCGVFRHQRTGALPDQVRVCARASSSSDQLVSRGEVHRRAALRVQRVRAMHCMLSDSASSLGEEWVSE